MNEPLVSFETAKLAKKKEFGYAIINSEEIQLIGKGFSYRGNYPVHEFSYWEYAPKSEYLKSEESVTLKTVTTNSSSFELIMEEYSSDGNQYGYRAYLAPTQALLQKWLREVHTLHVEASLEMISKFGIKLYVVSIHIQEKEEYFGITCRLKITGFTSYEEALEAGLLEALKLIKI